MKQYVREQSERNMKDGSIMALEEERPIQLNLCTRNERIQSLFKNKKIRWIQQL